MTGPSTRQALRAAVESGDIDSILALLAPGVRFHTPVAFKPFEGQGSLRPLFEILRDTFKDFRYTDELGGEDGLHGLLFEARVGDKQLQGIDLIRLDSDGLIEEFTVMIRPASALMALGEVVRARLAADAGQA